ncbi:hypothetical protein [Changchengzhania lutea]|uniref:hypothetical protein n=1 Tax=Changchengzhania lutea TaxID=2049305 RepID=UPI00115DE499|nr:hypothetical protein [Changchengzhania lutea]
MKSKHITRKYEAWLSPEIMHNASRKWLSELRFAKDEELFFNDLIKSYTLQLIDSKYFKESKALIDKISTLEKETNRLIEIIKTHENDLRIMVDGIDQLDKEEAYKKEHGKLIVVISDFKRKYRAIKTKLFTLVKSIIKEGKQKRLLQ